MKVPLHALPGPALSLTRPAALVREDRLVDSLRLGVEDGAHQGAKLGRLAGASALSLALPLGLAVLGAQLGAAAVVGVALSPVGLIGGLVAASLAERHVGVGRRAGAALGAVLGLGLGLARHLRGKQDAGPVELPFRPASGAPPSEGLAPRLLHSAQRRFLGQVPERNQRVEVAENVCANATTMLVGGLWLPQLAASLLPMPFSLVFATVAGPALGVVAAGVLENALGLGRVTGELLGHAANKLLPPPGPAKEPPPHRPPSALKKAFFALNQVIAEPILTTMIDATRVTNRLFAQEPSLCVAFQPRPEPRIDDQRLLDNFVKLAGINGVSGQEQEVGRELKRQLEELGISSLEKPDGTLIATVPGTVSDAPTLILSAHQDTVAPTSAQAIRITDRKVQTDGSHILGADNRAGLAQILEAVRVVLETGQERPEIKLVFTVSEETGLTGAGRLAPQDLSLRPALGVVVDSTDVRDLNLTNDAVLVNPTRSLRYQFSQEDPVVQLAMVSMARGGTRPRPLRVPIMTGAGTDANTLAFNSGNIRSIAIGCGQRDIHTPHENILRSDLSAVARTLVGCITNCTDFRVDGGAIVPRLSSGSGRPET
ncbi:MAG: hypothetical protein AMXMBFR33_58790 [Candidatus Xenobia bacterium]